MNDDLQRRLTRFQLAALSTGVVGLLGCGAGALADPRGFFSAYLAAYVAWLGLPIGSALVVMIYHLTGGRWGFPVRRFLEAALATLPMFAWLFLPLVAGLRELYPWAQPGSVAASEVLQKRMPYFTTFAFLARAAFFFACWLGLAAWLRRWSLGQDGDTALRRSNAHRLRTLSGPGLVILPLTATFAYVDWIMSIESEWFSTVFAAIVLIGQLLAALAFATVLLHLFRREEPFTGVVSQIQFHQLGNLLLTFVLFWTYIAFGQCLIIYSGNLPHEIGWYLHRIAGSWKWLLAVLALFHFFVPFLLLLFRFMKQRSSALATIAAMILATHFADAYWLVKPSFYPRGMILSWLDVAAPLGIGGIWIGMFLRALRAAPLLPRSESIAKPTFAHA